ncbi:hypothetical protein NL676_030230 [Syzygium grande]|nr:hypothetical protein NL676_030230 [Syzygium grande]
MAAAAAAEEELEAERESTHHPPPTATATSSPAPNPPSRLRLRRRRLGSEHVRWDHGATLHEAVSFVSWRLQGRRERNELPAEGGWSEVATILGRLPSPRALKGEGKGKASLSPAASLPWRQPIAAALTVVRSSHGVVRWDSMPFCFFWEESCMEVAVDSCPSSIIS